MRVSLWGKGIWDLLDWDFGTRPLSALPLISHISGWSVCLSSACAQLYLGSKYVALPGSQIQRCIKLNHTLSFIHISFREYVDETLRALELILGNTALKVTGMDLPVIKTWEGGMGDRILWSKLCLFLIYLLRLWRCSPQRERYLGKSYGWNLDTIGPDPSLSDSHHMWGLRENSPYLKITRLNSDSGLFGF